MLDPVHRAPSIDPNLVQREITSKRVRRSLLTGRRAERPKSDQAVGFDGDTHADIRDSQFFARSHLASESPDDRSVYWAYATRTLTVTRANMR